MTQRFLNGIICAAMALGLSAGTARAQIITSPDFASWSGAVGPHTNVAIPDPGVGGGDGTILLGIGTASVTYDGVVFSTSAGLSNGEYFNIGPDFAGVPAVLSSQSQTTGVANILITLPGSETGIAFNYGTFDGSSVTFTLSNGDTLTQGSTESNGYSVPDFLGITDATPFTSILVTSAGAGEVLSINNISFPNAVPEPSSLALCGVVGVVGVAVYARRRLLRA